MEMLIFAVFVVYIKEEGQTLRDFVNKKEYLCIMNSWNTSFSILVKLKVFAYKFQLG